MYWSKRKRSLFLFNQFTRCFEETRAKYYQIISSYGELQLCVDKKIWQKYEGTRQKDQNKYIKLIQNFIHMAVECDQANIEEEGAARGYLVVALAELSCW